MIITGEAVLDVSSKDPRIYSTASTATLLSRRDRI